MPCFSKLALPPILPTTYAFTLNPSWKTEINEIKNFSQGIPLTLLRCTARPPLQTSLSPPPPALPTDPRSFRPPNPAGARGRATWWAIHAPSPFPRTRRGRTSGSGKTLGWSSLTGSGLRCTNIYNLNLVGLCWFYMLLSSVSLATLWWWNMVCCKIHRLLRWFSQ